MEITKIFPTRSTSVGAYFQRTGAAFYIPLYQRQYSWDEANVSQMMEDVMKGVSLFTENQNDRDKIFKFLGTLITVQAKNNQINAGDIDALPTRIDMIIDGQQRLTTLCLISTQIYPRILRLSKLPYIKDYGLEMFTRKLLAQIRGVFSISNQYDDGNRKPIIIREAQDKWTLEASSGAYTSSIASFEEQVIELMDSSEDVPLKEIDNEFIKNAVKIIRANLETVEGAHLSKSGMYGEYPDAWSILNSYPEEELWEFERPFKATVLEIKSNIDANHGGIVEVNKSITEEQSDLLKFVQLTAFTRFMFNRCGFTVIEPESQEWAFDMFQSLNATGTPLTAIETFKPLVTENSENSENKKFRELFSKVDDLFASAKTSAAKTKLTNLYLSNLAVIRSGYKIGTRFSEQRSYLLKQYSSLQSLNDKENFLRFMSNLAVYMSLLGKFKSPKSEYNQFDDKIEKSDRKIVNFCLAYLASSGHDISNAAIAKAFGDPKDKSDKAREEFASAVKAVAAFYTLWRAANSTSRLDDVYRSLFKEGKEGDLGRDFVKFSDADSLKEYFRSVLEDKGMGSFEEWYSKAYHRFEYKLAGKHVCRFALLITTHDTKIEVAPYVTEATKGYRPYLSPEIWNSPSVASVEHIAPQTHPKDSQWDKDIYSLNSQVYDKIGNLTLLPKGANSSASNKNWKEKYIYYAYMSAEDTAHREEVLEEAKTIGFDTNRLIFDDMGKLEYQHHLNDIKKLGILGEWSAAVILQRTENISKILFKRMMEWLS